MQNKYLHWFNLAAYLPAILLHFAMLLPLLAAPAVQEFSLMNACACGCTPVAGAACCCNCAPGGKKEETSDRDVGVFTAENPAAEKKLSLSPTGCFPAQDGWTPPAPAQDHLGDSAFLLSTVLEFSTRQEDVVQKPCGAGPKHRDKVPI